jgi:alpha-tubulin suppressor-like RCC1 family protein
MEMDFKTLGACRNGSLRGSLLAALATALLCTLALALTGASASARPAAGAGPQDEKAPKITTAPVNATVDEGQSASFEAAAVGPPTPTVQWLVSTNEGATWANVEGGTSDKLTVPNTKVSESGDQYRAVFKNSAGQASTKAVLLTVLQAPYVTQQPLSVTVEEGAAATFDATASGSPTPTTQWQISTNAGHTWTSISGATSSQYSVPATKSSQSGYEYRALFTSAAGSTPSEAATLTVQKIPALSKQPVSVTVEEGHSASFEANASGFPAPTVQWELSTNAGGSWSPVAGATTDVLTIASASTSEDGDEYRAVFENAAGKATSEAAKLTVGNPPKVTEQPQGATVQAGQSATFEAAASGYPTPTVQWELSTNTGSTWSTVAGATSNQLTISGVSASENGDEYRAQFANVAGTAYSEAATLTVAVHHYTAVAWGQNTYGQLGNASTEPSYVPEPVSGLSYVTAVAGGTRHSLALLSNGTVMAWGADEWGQLGGGGEALTMSDVPIQVPGLTNVTAIAAGANFSLALLSNGTVMAWGGNLSGQLGNGSYEESELPVQVKGLPVITAIAAGGEHALALQANGKVAAWGAGERGQLGDNNTNNSDVPVAVQDLTGAVGIAAGVQHSLAVLSSGKVEAWGGDEYGQLGDSSVPENEEGERMTELPVAVEGVSGASAVAAGARHSLALLSNGTVMAWGEDKAGQLGTGTIAREQETPATVSGLAGARAISAGGEHSMALLATGAVLTWGENHFGELGNGTIGEPSDVPVAVSALNEVSGISAGGSHDLAYGEAIPTVTGVSPDVGASTGGTQVTITGTSFSEATSVKFGSASAESFTVESPTKILAQAPAGTLGTVDVTVTTVAGTSAKGAADKFTYLAAPTIKKIAPKAGPATGGTVVTITGTGLTGATSVSFGANAGKVLSVKSATAMTVESPAGTGTVSVKVTAPGGTSAASGHASFKYKKPKTKK